IRSAFAGRLPCSLPPSHSLGARLSGRQAVFGAVSGLEIECAGYIRWGHVGSKVCPKGRTPSSAQKRRLRGDPFRGEEATWRIIRARQWTTITRRALL